ncbi:MAG TPA: sn-glycerol-3-phosphate ABC transporter ATP-binding protein UgpC [Burkholderiaceae bacterium]
MSRIELRKVNKRYGEVAVLHDIDLTIESGEFCVFIGPSGCGKSTLLRMVAGLEDISGGEVLIDGRVVNELPPSQRDVAMVFQSYALYPHMSVYENMAFGLRHLRMPEAEIRQRVDAAAKSLHLEPLLDRKPRALSGGQRQRVAIGRAIVRKPRLFLFDEPLSNLDAALRSQTRVEIARLHRSLQGVSMIYVTHDQVEAMTLADKVVLLRPDIAGKGVPSIAQVGPPMELYERPRNLFVASFIGSPSMNFLRGRVASVDGHGLVVRLACGLEVRAAVEGTRALVGQDVTVGIRPEHVVVGSGAGRGQVTHVEHLGEATQLYLQVPGEERMLLAKTGAPAAAIDQQLAFEFPERRVHVFLANEEALPRLAVGEPAREAA